MHNTSSLCHSDTQTLKDSLPNNAPHFIKPLVYTPQPPSPPQNHPWLAIISLYGGEKPDARRLHRRCRVLLNTL